MNRVTIALLEPLAQVFTAPKNLAAMGEKLEAYCPLHATTDQLEEIARRIIETRKLKSFPSMADLIALVRFIPPPATAMVSSGKWTKDHERRNSWDFREQEALDLLRGSPLVEEALANHWARALIDFAMTHKRLPNPQEQKAAVALTRANDRAAHEFHGALGPSIRGLRDAMVGHAEALLIRLVQRDAA